MSVPLALAAQPGRGVGGSLRAAVGDFYHHSLRLVALNAALCGTAVAVLLAGLWTPAALALLVLLGPLAMALMHCAVVLVRTDELELRCAVAGLRLHWRRGLVLGAAALAAAVLGIVAIVFYARAGGLVWPLALVAAYLLAGFAVFQVTLWPLAALQRDVPLLLVLRRAFTRTVQRPLDATLLAFALAIVNLAGLAAAVMPFLTLTVAYSFLAAAHFALPRDLREAPHG